MTIGVDGDGGVTFADGRYLIRKVAPPLPGLRRRRARAAVRRRPRGLRVRPQRPPPAHPRRAHRRRSLKTFEYDAAKQLIGVVDAFGNAHADRARRRRQGARDRRSGRPAHRADRQRRRLARERHQPGRRGAPLHLRERARSRASASPRAARRASTTTPTGRLIAPSRRRRRGAHARPATEGEGGTRVTITTGAARTTKYSMQVLDQRRPPPHDRDAHGRQDDVDRARRRHHRDCPTPTAPRPRSSTAPDPRWGAQVPVIAEQDRDHAGAARVDAPKRKDTVALAVPRDPFSMTLLRTSFTETGGGTASGVQRRHRRRETQRRGRREHHADARRLRPRDQADARHRRGAR